MMQKLVKMVTCDIDLKFIDPVWNVAQLAINCNLINIFFANLHLCLSAKHSHFQFGATGFHLQCIYSQTILLHMWMIDFVDHRFWLIVRHKLKQVLLAAMSTSRSDVVTPFGHLFEHRFVCQFIRENFKQNKACLGNKNVEMRNHLIFI